MSFSSNAPLATNEVVIEPTLAGAGVDCAGETHPARLVVLRGSRAGSAVALGMDETSVGRATCNDVVLADISVSRRHALLRREPGGYVVVDRDSANGTRLNGRSVQRARLRNGDEIALGDAVVQFVAAGGIAARGSAPSVYGLAEMLRSAIDWRRTAVVSVVVLLSVAMTLGVGGKHREGASPAIASAAVTAAPSASSTPIADLRHGDVEQAQDAVEHQRASRSAVTAAKVPRASGATASQIRAAYAAGNLTHAIALARAAPGARRLLTELDGFDAAWREGIARAGERRYAEAIVALERAESADAAIGPAHRGPLAQKVRKTLASLHLQAGMEQLAAGRLAQASVHVRSALRRDPDDDAVREEWRRIADRANEAYLRGYVAKDIDEAAAREEFQTVVAALPASDATAQKARRWLERFDGEPARED
jgi:pSer/pThr/pTyr-binding forkhead associated (FHA) protein